MKKRHALVVVGSVRRAFRSLRVAAGCGWIGTSLFLAGAPVSAATPIALSCAEAPAGLGHVIGNVRTAVIDDCLTVQGQQMAVRMLDSRMSVSVQVNGYGPFRFLVDSGADRSVIGVALAKRLNLPAGENVRLNDVAGATNIGTFLVDDLKVGDSSTLAISAPGLPEQFLGAQGIVGVDALTDRRIMMDFQDNSITLEDARLPEKVQPGEIVVVGHRRHGQLILTEVRVNGMLIYAVIDTGSDTTIGNIALMEKIAGSRHPPSQMSMILNSVTGRSTEATGLMLARIDIGALRIHNLRVAFADVAPFAIFGLSDRPALLLGTDALRGLRRMSLDFRQYRVRFQLRD